MHVLNWLGNSPRIILPDLGMDIKDCSLVGGGKVKCTKQKDGQYIIQFSTRDMKPVDTIIELDVEGNVMGLEPVDVAAESLSYHKSVSASSNPNAKWNDVSNVVNGDWSGHFWKPAKDDQQPWITIDIGKNEKISKAVLFESGRSVKAFELQYKKGDNWTTIYEGTTIGEKAAISFSKIEARQLRLLITDTSDVSGIYEIVLL